ncbi:MAG TPA: hypothetical protein VK773_14235 [Acidimicrobiales bacterium]|nr:hypothetical protein [Acidimicrobiales bacterium]
MARGRPNWWVILAVSLALMALLVATSGNPRRAPGGAHGIANAQSSDSHGTHRTGGSSRSMSTGAARTTTTTDPAAAGADTAATALTSTHAPTMPTTTQPASAPLATTTTVVVVPTTTTTTTIPSQPLGAGSHQGVIEPPAQRSSSVGFTGTGAMQVSVVWSGSTYLTMQVSCPSGSQNVGGTSAMQASLPDASGSCLATVSEPASESTALTYTITIGPSGG